jgi:stress responsive alpha/beta barrel protein
VVTHLVLMKPRPDLSAADREQLIAAFERALTEILAVRRVRVGRRITHGAGYEAGMPDAADYLVAIEFEDVEGLAAYLRHPAHEALGARFTESLAGALVYDFEEIGLKSLRDLPER